ncbi:glycosyltransferase [Microcella sp.]|uniref:glycosyltransferase n=1 Tax=Microcella sp. TaxID=1913979 RepID=UPI0039189C10
MSMTTRLREVVRRAIDRLPEPLAVRLRPRRYRYDLAEVPSAPPQLAALTRVVIGATNYAAQGYLLARALERLDGVAAINVHQRPAGSTFGFPADISVSGDIVRLSSHWRRRQFAAIAGRYSHAIIESGRPIFGTLFDLDVAREIDALRARGVRVAHLAHGSDLRSPRIHRQFSRFSPFHDDDWDARDALQDGSDRYARLIAESGGPVFVTTPDLLRDQPTAHWMPVIVDPERWAAPEPPLSRTRPVVLHAPTNSHIKGTALIEPTLRRMHAAGLIDYRPVSGVPASQMPDLVRAADIVIDQVRLGIYSVAAVEAMAAGRIVIAHLHDDVVEHVAAATGTRPPIVSCWADELEVCLEDVLADRDNARQEAAAGPEFVRRVHDGALSARIVADAFLASPS